MSRTALYRLFDAAGQLLYVGIATSPRTRWYAHREEKRWWPQVARESVEWFPSRTDAKAAEKTAIRAEAPVFNVTHSATRKRGDAMAENKSKYPRVRTLRMPDPDWSDAVAVAAGNFSSAVNQFIRWYLRRPGAKLPERPSIEEVARLTDKAES
jgi:excinuclease UvrABC nuclease subunit